MKVQVKRGSMHCLVGGLKRSPKLLALLLLFACFVASGRARGDEIVPVATELPPTLTLEEAMRIFRTRGLDLLIADAQVRTAEGQVTSAAAIANPVVTGSVGNSITYANSEYSRGNCLVNGAQCTPWVFNVGVSDSAAVMDTLSGKRDLRQRVARNALAAAKMNRVDAERTLAFEVKTAFIQVAQAELGYKFAKEVAATNQTTLQKFQDRLSGGAVNLGDLQRIETQKLESDGAVDNAVINLRQARVTLAFLLGVRGGVPDFDVDTAVLDYSVPLPLTDATEVALLRVAFDHRPDLSQLGYMMASSQAQIELIRRQRFPDVTLGVNYSWGGFGGTSTNGPVGPQILTFGLSVPLPVFYQLQGETKQAEGIYDANTLAHAKLTSQVVNDVSSGFASYVGTRRLVERMEGPRRANGGLLQSAKGAFDIIAIQYESGSANLTDYLDALRTYIAIKGEYFGDLTNYWTAVYQLEQAVAMDLR